jgi:hypothetical protein
MADSEQNAGQRRGAGRDLIQLFARYRVFTGLAAGVAACAALAEPSIVEDLSTFLALAAPAQAYEKKKGGGDWEGFKEGKDFQKESFEKFDSGDFEKGKFEKGDKKSGEDEDSGDRTGDKRERGGKNRNFVTDDDLRDDASKPPKTVEQWLKRLFKAESDQLDQAKQASPAEPTHPIPKSTATGRAWAPDLEEVTGHEVLAVNASPQTVAKAKALGFNVAPSANLKSLAFSVTRLVPPQGMSTREAQQLLARDLPWQNFGINQKYRIYRTATGTKPEELKGSAAARPSGGMDCERDHCFARSLIGWKTEIGSCAAGTRIGIIDTAIDLTHPALANKKVEIRHLGPGGTPGPNWHGTGVAALLAGDPRSGTPGLIPDAQFAIADIFHADEDGEPTSDTFSMLRALDWLDAKNVKIINMSLSGPKDELVRQAIGKLAAKGVLLVAAAGNDGPAALPSYPAAYESVIAVTAVGKDLRNYRYANRGDYIDVAAPGVLIWTAFPGAMEGYHSGTSFATPYVTATLAAINGGVTLGSRAEALQKLAFRDLGTPGRDPVYGEGLLVALITCGASRVARSASNPVQSVETLSGSPTVEDLPWSRTGQ